MFVAHASTDSLAWTPHPDVWVLVGVLVASYFFIVWKVGPRYVSPGDPPASGRQVAFFLSGVAAIWVAADWPVHEVSERYLFSVHMLQHMAFMFAAAPLLLLGLPEWLVRRILRPKPVMAVARVFTRPVPAMLLFNGFIVFSHWPAVVNSVVRSEPMHFSMHVVLMAVSVLMWWPVLSPLAELPRLSQPAQMLYLFLQTIVPTVPASFLTFSESPLYVVYAEAPRLWGISALTDQRVSGLIMKLGGGVFLWSVIAFLFFRWSAREESGTPDVRDWQSIELELNRVRAAR